MNFKYYLMELLEPTILFGAAAALIGVAAAAHYGSINVFLAAICVIGVVISHASVNVISDYVDYKSGLDKEQTKVRTPFSGGSPLIVGKKLRPSEVLGMGLLAFAIAAIIGIYLISIQPIVIPLVLVGAVTILFYAKYLNKIPFMAETVTAISMFCATIGAYIVSGGSLSHLVPVVFAGAAAGIQVGLILYTNEVPDRDLDAKYGRKSTIIMLWDRKAEAKFYIAVEAITYLIVLAAIAIGYMPIYSVIVLLTLPLAVRIYHGMANYKNPKSYTPFMAKSAMAVMGFMLLVIISYL